RFIMSLEAPIGRVSAPDSVYPFGAAENDWLPQVDDVINSVKNVLSFE
ncbi:MAG: alpha-ketoacid dehydrogenase subunit beta, partial [Pseudolactococcus raffinolactis]